MMAIQWKYGYVEFSGVLCSLLKAEGMTCEVLAGAQSAFTSTDHLDYIGE